MITSQVAVVLAHQGGWDEALLAVVPLGVVAGLIFMGARRARALEEHDPSE